MEIFFYFTWSASSSCDSNSFSHCQYSLSCVFLKFLSSSYKISGTISAYTIGFKTKVNKTLPSAPKITMSSALPATLCTDTTRNSTELLALCHPLQTFSALHNGLIVHPCWARWKLPRKKKSSALETTIVRKQAAF